MTSSIGRLEFTSTLKHGWVTPLLKKLGLDKSIMAIYRPLINLSTMSKLLEWLVLSRLQPHVLSSSNFSEFQSAYRAGHSTETAPLPVHNDLVRQSKTSGQPYCLRLIIRLRSTPSTPELNDILAILAYQSWKSLGEIITDYVGKELWKRCIDFNTLFDHLRLDFGLGGFALDWLRSFLVDRTRFIPVNISDVSVQCPSRKCAWSVLVCDVHFSRRMGCFSTLTRRKKFRLQLKHSRQKLTHLLWSMLLESKLLSVLLSSCSAWHLTKICLSIATWMQLPNETSQTHRSSTSLSPGWSHNEL